MTLPFPKDVEDDVTIQLGTNHCVEFNAMDHLPLQVRKFIRLE